VLAVVQHPIVDLRSMLPTTTGLIEAPDWRWLPVHGNEFVRELGAVRPRARSGVQPWSGEAFFVNSKAGLKFASATQWCPEINGELKPVFRRYFSDGVVGRLEVGVRTPWLLDPEEPAAPVAVAVSTLRLPMRLRRSAPTPFLGLGEGFARFLVSATTRTDRNRRPEKVPSWWAVAGTPVVVCELDLEELDPGSEATVRERLATSPSGSALVEQRWLTIDNIRVSLWFVVPSAATAPDITRRLRIHVSRLHAEHEAFRCVLRLCDRGRLDVNTSPSVRDFIDERAGFLLRRNFAGFPQRELLEVVLDTWETAYADDLTRMRTVAQGLTSVGLTRKVEDVVSLASGTAKGCPGMVVQLYLNNNKGAINVSDQRSVDQSVSFSGNSGPIAGVQTGSGNTQSIGEIDQTINDLPKLAQELTGAISSLRGALPGGELDEVSDYASSIEEEAKKPEPDRGKIRRFVAKISAWAESAGPPALKVLEAAAQIAALVAAVA
jgi:hypothetical protein